jgi:hypothetical protein
VIERKPFGQQTPFDSLYPHDGYHVRRGRGDFHVIEIDHWACPLYRDPAWVEAKRREQRSDKDFRREFCVRGSARILTADLEWVEARTLTHGSVLVGFDENLKGYFRFQPALVTVVREIKAPSVKVITDRGTITVSEQHQFVVRNRGGSYGNVPTHVWKEAQDLQPEDQILFFGQPWEREESWSAGWLAGMFDGEGSIGKELTVAQNPGLLLDYLKEELEARGLDYAIGHPNKGTCASLRMSKIHDVMRTLGTIRPRRLLETCGRFWAGRSVIPRSGTRYANVQRTLKSDKTETFLAITTSTRTFIADGYFSHNCRDWASPAGDAYYPEFQVNGGMDTYVAKIPGLLVGQPVFRLWDFGFRRPACLWAQKDPHRNRLYVLREMMPGWDEMATSEEGIDVRSFRDAVLCLSGVIGRASLGPRAQLLIQRIADSSYPSPPWFVDGAQPIQWVDFAGPECHQINDQPEEDSSSRTRAQILGEAGIEIQVRTQGKGAREDIIRELLKVRRPCQDGHGEECPGHPGLLFDPACAILIRGFAGGIAYERATPQNPLPVNPIKDGYFEHLHDCLGYGVLGLFPAHGSRPLPTPAVRYEGRRRVDVRQQMQAQQDIGLWSRIAKRLR